MDDLPTEPVSVWEAVTGLPLAATWQLFDYKRDRTECVELSNIKPCDGGSEAMMLVANVLHRSDDAGRR